MNEGVYPKRSEYAQRAEGENRVELNYAEESALRNALDEQMLNCGLSGLQKTLMHVVFRQTIGYHKRCEDFNGVRLEKLAGSRYDYCNRNIKTLIANSMLIAREGYYGRILAINFNFSQWGTAPEEHECLYSDPEAFVQKHCASDSTYYEASDQAVKNAAAQPPVIAYALIDFDAGSACNEACYSKTSDILGPENHRNVLAFKPVETPPEKCETSKAASDVHETEAAVIPTCETKTALASALLGESETSKLNEQPKVELCTVKADDNKTTTAELSLSFPKELSLSFPKELKPHEKKAIEKLIAAENIDDKNAFQLLLDHLKSRYEISDWQPIRSPIAYFRSLLKRLKEQSFITDYADIFRERSKAEQQQREEEKQTLALRAESDAENKQREDVYGNYRQVALMAFSAGCSIREMAIKLRWQDLIEAMGFDLDADPQQVLNGT